MEEEHTGETSTYHLRASYLQALKRYMANWHKMSEAQMYSDDIDAYFLYEKQFSSQLQALLKQVVHKPLQP
jgi:hypothetical protein